MVGEEIFKEREEIRTRIINELKNILQIYVHSASEIVEINNEFIRTEDTSLRIIEKIDLLLDKHNILKNLIEKNANVESQNTLANDISNIINNINTMRQILEQNIDNIITHLKKAIEITVPILAGAVKINRKDIVKKILVIQRNMGENNDLLLTLKKQLPIINYYNNLFSKNNYSYQENIKIECQKEELKIRLNLIKETLKKNIIDRKTSIKTQLLLLKPFIENTITTI